MAERFPAINETHDCSHFDCGDDEINRYLQRHALPNHVRGLSKTYVALAPGSDLHVVGYYTIAPTQVDAFELPRSMARGLPRYPVPGFRLGRLGVSLDAQHRGLGQDLVFAAAARAALAAVDVGGLLLLIDAKSQSLADWYCTTFRALPLNSRPTSVVVSLRRFMDAIRAGADTP